MDSLPSPSAADSEETTPSVVLYVDADPSETVAAALERGLPGFDVRPESDPAEALSRLAVADCVVAGYDLDGTDGVALLRAVRRHRPDLPFVLFPADGSELVASDAVAAGVTDYLPRAVEGTTVAERTALLAARLAARVDAADGDPSVASADGGCDTRATDGDGDVGTAHEEHSASTEQPDPELMARALDEAELGVSIAPAEGDTPMTYVNDGFTRITGYETSEVLGRNCRFLQGEETDDRPVATLRRAVEERKPTTVTLRNYRKDGEPFWNQVDVTPVTDDAGEVTHFIGFQRDVTERKRLAAELEASETALRKLYRATTDRTLPFAERLETTLAVGCDRLGLSAGFLTRIDEADGTQTVVHAVGSHEGLQAGEECPLSEAYCRRTVEGDGLLSVVHAAEEGWADNDAYTRFGLEAYLGGKVFVDGELYGTLCFADTDPRAEPFTESEVAFVEVLTRWTSYELERRERERALRTAERRFRSLFENPLTFVGILDDEARIVELNDTAVAAVDADAEALLGTRFCEAEWWAPSEDSVETVRGAVASALDGETARFECDYWRADGKASVSATVHPIHAADDGGSAPTDDPGSLLVIGYDVTTRTEQADQLRQQRDRLDEFASVVSHDLRSPLEVARGRLDLYETVADVDAGSAHLAAVGSSLDRMATLVDDLLALAQQGETVDVTESVDVGDVARTAWSTVETGTAALDLDVDLTVEADPTRLRQLFENLFRNSIEHGAVDSTTPPSVRVVGLSGRRGFAVEDDGEGVPEADRETVFDRGYTTQVEGTGLGLSIVGRIVEAHGWTVEATESETGGARFEVSVDDGVER